MAKKNVLVLTGSPRRGGNSERMADAFIQGALSAGHEAVKFEAARIDLKGCKACGACWNKGMPCVFDDGFNQLAPLLEQADVIVFAVPLYWFTFPAQIKAAIDKLNAYTQEKCLRTLKIKESLLMVCAADTEPDLFDGIKETYRLMARYMKWEDRGVLAVPGVSDKGDIERTDALAQAEEYGRTIA